MPFQSSISAWARCNTAVGSAAGPAQKLWARLLTSLSLFVAWGIYRGLALVRRFHWFGISAFGQHFAVQLFAFDLVFLVLTAVFASKPWPTERALQPDFVAWEAPPRFLVGYGMDVAGGMRGIPYVGAMD